MPHCERRTACIMRSVRTLLAALVSFVLLFAISFPAWGSTLWTAAGDQVRDRGTLMGMNFDGKTLECELRMVVPSQGFVYLGLFPLPSRKGQGPVAAINEKGLAIGVAAPEALSGSAGGRSARRI